MRLLATVALLAAALPARAESPVFRTLGAVDGLPSERVYALAEDPRGYLWVATADGLARFDGSRFDVFRHRPGDPLALPGNVTQSVHVAGDGRVWVGMEGQGLAWWQEGEGFRRWQVDPQAGELDVWAVTSDARGRIWFGGFASGLYRIDADRGGFRRWRVADGNGLRSDTVLSLASDAEGRVWIAGEEGLQFVADDSVYDLPATAGLPAGTVYKVGTAGNELLIASSAGAFRGPAERLRALGGSAPGPALALLDDQAGSLWVGRSRGVERVSARGSEHVLGAPRLRYSAGTHAVFDLLRDAEGGVWMATGGSGLLQLPPRWDRFRSWLVGPGGLQASVPRALGFAADGGLWVAGHDGAIEHIDAASGVLRLQVPAPAGAAPAVAGAIWQAHDGSLWLGHRGGLRHHPPAGPVREFAADGSPDAPMAGLVDLITADAGDGFWMSVQGGGIEHRDALGRLLRRYRREDGVDPADSEQIRLGPDAALWVAGGAGLLRLDATGSRFEAVPGLGGERVFGFVFASSDRLWLARRGGLQRYQREDGHWQLRDQLDVLEGAEVGGLAIDRFGLLWANTARGLFRIDPERRRARRFGVRDGLPGQEFASRPLAESADGLFAALLPEAVVRIDPSRFVETPRAPRLREEAVRLLRDGRRQRLPAAVTLTLRHDDREIELAGRVLSFSEPGQWRYRARLQPYDPDWIELGSEGKRVFSSLPPGSYRWQLQASGSDGVWHAAPERQLRVVPPWWRQPPALVLGIVLAVAALLAALHWLRARGRRRAARMLEAQRRHWAEQASAQKSRFLATLAHEIRTPMTGLLGMAELLAASPLDDRQAAQLAAMRSSGDLLLRLVNDALDLARIESGLFELRPRATDLLELAASCIESMRAMAAGKPVSLHLQAEPGLPRWRLADPERLRQILLNLLGNALKFTERGSVCLQLSADDAPWLRFEVIDTGPGLSAEQQARLFRRWSQLDEADPARRAGGAGLGLAISRELAEAMQGSLALHSEPGVGTRLVLRLPLPECADPQGQGPALVAAADTGRVLLVEDDPGVAEAVAGQLRAAGYEVVHAAHALQALAQIAQATWQAVVLDLDLPGMDGLTLAGLLRAQCPGLALMVLTARSDAAVEQEVRDAGVHAFLRKPASIAELVAALQQARQRAAAERPAAAVLAAAG